MTQELLNLRKQQIVDLKKQKGITTKAQVVVAMDYSGSMSRLYSNGTVQSLVEKLFPLALEFDDNGTLDFYLFHDGVIPMEGVTVNNYANYINTKIKGHMGGTNYAPVLKQIFDDKFTSGGFLGFGSKMKEKVKDPVYVIFITDGDNGDHAETTRFIKEISDKGMFIQFVWLGNSSFNYLEKLDDMGGRVLDNVDFFKWDIDSLSTEVLYSHLLTEFPNWVNEATARNFIWN